MRLALSFLTAFVLAGASLAQGGPHIALFLSLGNNEYNRSVERGVREIVESAGGAVTEFDANFDPAEQMNQLQDAITSQRFDAFIVYSVDGVSMTTGADAAAEAGIPLISVDAPIGTDRRTLVPYRNVSAQIARTGVGDGEQLGRAIVMACEGVNPCEVAFMIGFQGFPLDQDRLEAIKEILANHGHIEIVSVQAAQYLRDEGYAVSSNLLQANQNIDVIASVGDQMTLGAALAVEDFGLEGQVKLIGNGASEDGYRAVQDGTFFATVANIPFTNGKIAAQMALQAIAGELIVRSVDMYLQSPPIPASGAVITQESLGDFEPEW
jgi:ribose transport system substrate-binding protein